MASLLALACAGPAPSSPLPRVVATSPSGAVAPDAVRVEIAFSGPLSPDGIADGRLVALCRRDDLRQVSAQAEADPGLPGGTPVVAATASLDATATRITVTPSAQLSPDTAWAAVVSRRVRSADGRPILDVEGRARTVAVFFETGPAPDRTPPGPRWASPPDGPVPADLAELEVAFDEPVTGELGLADPAADPAAARPTTLGPSLLGLALTRPLPPGPLLLDLGAVHDAAGNAPSALPPMEVSPCLAAGAPLPTPAAEQRAGKLRVTLSQPLLGRGRLLVEYGAPPGEAACGSAPEAPATATVRGEVPSCPGWDPCHPAGQACRAEVTLAGLCPGRALRARLAAEDLAGHRGAPGPWVEVRALPPCPEPVLTEVLADAEAPEAGGEYAEVANLGTGEADLAGWWLAKRGPSGALTRCELRPATGGPLPPGGHALVVGGAYDGRYALAAAVPLYRCGKAALLGGLANDRPVALALEDPAGTVASTVGIVEAAPRCPQGALERIAPAGADAAANFACPGTRTPGACNASTPPAGCPRQPW